MLYLANLKRGYLIYLVGCFTTRQDMNNHRLMPFLSINQEIVWNCRVISYGSYRIYGGIRGGYHSWVGILYRSQKSHAMLYLVRLLRRLRVWGYHRIWYVRRLMEFDIFWLLLRWDNLICIVKKVLKKLLLSLSVSLSVGKA